MLSGALEQYEHAPVGLARLHSSTPGCLALRPLPHPDCGLAVPQVVRAQGRRAALTSRVILQFVFNVLLFIPRKGRLERNRLVAKPVTKRGMVARAMVGCGGQCAA